MAIPGCAALAIAVLLGVAAAAGSAHAAKLGPLALYSDFGEPLRAVIEVVEVNPQSSPVAAEVASPQTYAELGVAFPRSLEGATVRLFQQPDGRWLIRVATQRSVDERDFSLVLTLTTRIGRQVRQYSLASDGAVATAPRDGPTPSGPRVDDTAAIPAASVPPIRSQSDAPPATSSPAASSPTPMAKTTRPTAPTSPPEAQRAPAAPRPETVTVRPGDTAMSIARRVRPEDVSDEQTVMALYRANEGTFGGSVHRLAEGAVLRVPDAAALREVDPRAARAALRAQPFVPMASHARDRPGQDRVVLAGGGTGRATSERGGGGTEPAPTAAIALETATREATSRIRELEGIVATLRRLLDSLEQQIAAARSELATLSTDARPNGALAQPDRAAPLGAATATLIRLPAKDASAPIPSVSGSPPTDAAQKSPLSRLPSPAVLGAALAVLGLAGWLLWRRRSLTARDKRDPDNFRP
jgi:pilus assembly protein FimV